jgi:glycosyltransferase involved in cell wall biosynthesis
LVVNSPGFIPHIQQRGGKNITLISNGVDPTMFDPETNGAEFRQRLHLNDAFIATYTGAHGVSNDLEVLLSAARITASDPRIVFVLVGDGKEKTALRALAEQWGLTNVYFEPPVPKDDMKEVLAAADACIAILKPVELYKTTYPNKVFDYMAAGRPVICAIDGVIREVIEEADAGLFVAPGDADALAQAVLRLSNDLQGSREMGLNGRKCVVEHFDRRKNAKDMQALLQTLSRQQIS